MLFSYRSVDAKVFYMKQENLQRLRKIGTKTHPILLLYEKTYKAFIIEVLYRKP